MIMKSKKRIIEVMTNEQIRNCMNTNCIVQVWIQDEYDKQGSIEKFDEEVIRIDNEYYFRNICSVYTSKNYFKLVN